MAAYTQFAAFIEVGSTIRHLDETVILGRVVSIERDTYNVTFRFTDGSHVVVHRDHRLAVVSGAVAA